MSNNIHPKSVAIIGGGLAGLAAGCALSDSGYKVTVFEKRPYVGGRASSYEHPGTGEVLDNCQHLLLGCCTNLIEFYQRLGVADKVRWFDEITFMEPGGRISRFVPKKFLPAPAHNVPSFISVPMLEMKDKIAIARAMSAMSRKLPADSEENFLAWLKRHGQTEKAIKRFWEPVLVSALNEDLELISVRYAAKVFRDSFMKSAEAGRMGLPTIPLSQLYAAAIGYIQSRGGEVLLRNSVSAFTPKADGVALPAVMLRGRLISPCWPRRFRASATCCPMMSFPRRLEPSWSDSDLRLSPAFTFGLIVKLRICRMPRCLTGQSSGCSTSQSFRRSAKAREVMLNSW